MKSSLIKIGESRSISQQQGLLLRCTEDRRGAGVVCEVRVDLSDLTAEIFAFLLEKCRMPQAAGKGAREDNAAAVARGDARSGPGVAPLTRAALAMTTMASIWQRGTHAVSTISE
jgi:hypothetical protein